jgi:carboxymethylenebutenolidase
VIRLLAFALLMASPAFGACRKDSYAGNSYTLCEVTAGQDVRLFLNDAAGEKYGVTHFGITGYCMGGTFALRAACDLDGISAAAPFYGDIPEEDVLKGLRTPTVFISGTKDKWINPEKVAKLEEVVSKYELPVESVKYEADHAFFNNTRPEVYDPEAAMDAWAVVTGFFRDRL